MTRTVLILGTFDTKAEEHAWLRERILAQGCDVVTMDVGVHAGQRAFVLFPVDVAAAEVALAGGSTLDSLRAANDRGAAMRVMGRGAGEIVQRLWSEQRFAGVIGMGGSGGTSIITTAMQCLPIGVPKVCVSTVAGTDTAPYVGSKDIVLMPSVTDVAGLNRISRRIIANAAGAISGMTWAELPAVENDRPIIVASMFGNTTDCVNACRLQLDRDGYEVLVFHAVGSGGRTMETLIDEGFVAGCLDLTTTEWADELCGGIFGAGENRLAAAGRMSVPHVIAPGCVDMVNFGPPDTVPPAYRDAGRLLFEWNPSVTLMRTNLAENRRLGEIFASKANTATGPIAFILPLRGVSVLDGDGQRFCDRAADQAMFGSLKQHLRSDIPVVEVDANINDPAFATRAVELMQELMLNT